MDDETPLVKSLADLTNRWRQAEITDDGEKFLQTTFTFVTKDYRVYFGQFPDERLTLAIINNNLKRVPDEEVYPEAPPHITRVTTKANSSLFFKGPSMAFYNSLVLGQLAEVLLREAEVLELLASKKHPNIIQYHGCQVYRNRIVALALDRHPWTLLTCDCDLDAKSGFDDINSAVRYLHSIGLAHNDITASNIVISESKRWILIDFGSCRPFGEKIIMAGNSEWTTSSEQNDEAALRKLRCWLFDPE